METMRQWVREGRIKDLHRLYDDPYGNPGPTKIPAGRIELTIGGKPAFDSASLDLADAQATVRFKDGAGARVFVHATEPVGVIEIESSETVSLKLLAPPFAGQITDEAGPGKISAGDLASLRYKAPVEKRGDNWTGYLQEGWGGFKFAVVAVWKRTGDKWMGTWSVTTSNESDAPFQAAKYNCMKALGARFDDLRAGHRKWWDSYWGKSSVRVPNAVI
ncbi:MAG: glycoside hydrolase family 95 protein, partial [Planctomycetota bacterium]